MNSVWEAVSNNHYASAQPLVGSQTTWALCFLVFLYKLQRHQCSPRPLVEVMDCICTRAQKSRGATPRRWQKNNEWAVMKRYISPPVFHLRPTSEDQWLYWMCIPCSQPPFSSIHISWCIGGWLKMCVSEWATGRESERERERLTDRGQWIERDNASWMHDENTPGELRTSGGGWERASDIVVLGAASPTPQRQHLTRPVPPDKER